MASSHFPVVLCSAMITIKESFETSVLENMIISNNFKLGQHEPLTHETADFSAYDVHVWSNFIFISFM